MDFPDFTKQGVVQASGVDEFLRSSLHTPTSSSRWQGHEPRAWKEVLENPRECKNPIMLSEPGQRVVRAIREICGARQGMTSQCTQQQGIEVKLAVILNFAIFTTQANV